MEDSFGADIVEGDSWYENIIIIYYVTTSYF
jgi:hypothetical protein